jgi:hypothetical protein
MWWWISAFAAQEPIGRCQLGQPGERRWVRETWGVGARPCHLEGWRDGLEYKADEHDLWGSELLPLRAVDVPDGKSLEDYPNGWRSPVSMPRWASRFTIENESVRVERLQAISEEDARAAGFEARPFPNPCWQGYMDVNGRLIHQQALGEKPPAWMIDPKRMEDHRRLDRSAIDAYRAHLGLCAWDANPFVWVVEGLRRAPTNDRANQSEAIK